MLVGCVAPAPEPIKLKAITFLPVGDPNNDPFGAFFYTADSHKILKNAELMAGRCEVRISLPLIAGVNDSEENVKKTIEFTASLGIKHIGVVPYHRLGESKYQFLGLKSPFSDFDKIPEERVNNVVKMIESSGLKATKGRSM